ncbi:hypothetical protein ZWY2020_033592 [Hordeum vulgare]|nr:hypothetical protein ZWY2020_033592 [Hordeum vulgare]
MAAIIAALGQEQEQDFNFFVVVDFEATCLKDARIFPQEIIEFPTVLVDGATGHIESVFTGIEKPSYFDKWINLRIPFQAALGGVGRVNLQEAVREAGLDWEGRLHCGLDDALNTARLLAEIMRRKIKITITGSLASPPPPGPSVMIQKHPPCTSPCGGLIALVSPAPPIEKQSPHTCPSLALVSPPSPIQQ